MKVLVTGGTGTVGSRVARRLVDRGVDTAILTRRSEGLERVVEGASAVVGDLLDRGSLARAMEGVDRLFLLTPLHPEEAQMGRNAAAAAAEAGVQRVVLLSVYHVERGPHLPHFKSKLDIADALAAEGHAHVVLKPNSFFQNDLMATEALADHGVFVEPFGPVGVQRVDARDIADAGVAALLDEGMEGTVVPVNGPDVLTEDDCARVWSEALGREVRPVGGPDAWRSMMAPHMPDWLLDDLEAMYRLFGAEGNVASEEDVARQRAVLGREPRRYRDFVEEVAEGLG